MTNQTDNSNVDVLAHDFIYSLFSSKPGYAAAQLRQANARLSRQVFIRTAQLRVSDAALVQSRRINEDLRNTLEEERTRISREIHDQLGQSLTLLKFDVAYMQAHLKTEPFERSQVQSKLAAMTLVLNDTIKMMRQVATELRPSILDDFGLVAALEGQVQGIQTRTGIHCDVTSNIPHIHLGQNMTTGLFRMAQEALTNVIRHAQATQVHVRLTVIEADECLILEVLDNGKGITESEKLAPSSLGLLGLAERAQLLGGSASVVGISGQGTTVTIRIPLDPSASPVTRV